MLAALLLAMALNAAGDLEGRHARLVSDEDHPEWEYHDSHPSLITPSVFLTVGGLGTLTAIPVFYAGIASSVVGGAGIGMSSAAIGVGVALLALGVVLIGVAVVFAIIGSFKLTRALQHRQQAPPPPDQQPYTVEREAPRLLPSNAWVVASF